MDSNSSGSAKFSRTPSRQTNHNNPKEQAKEQVGRRHLKGAWYRRRRCLISADLRRLCTGMGRRGRLLDRNGTEDAVRGTVSNRKMSPIAVKAQTDRDWNPARRNNRDCFHRVVSAKPKS